MEMRQVQCFAHSHRAVEGQEQGSWNNCKWVPYEGTFDLDSLEGFVQQGVFKKGRLETSWVLGPEGNIVSGPNYRPGSLQLHEGHVELGFGSFADTLRY